MLGSEDKANAAAAGFFRIVTPKMEALTVRSSDIESEEDVEPSGGLKRYFLKPECTIQIDVTGEAIAGLDFSTKSILKWVDDGGTIRKSRDE